MENDPRFNAIAMSTCQFCGEGYIKDFIGQSHDCQDEEGSKESLNQDD